jgi:hypothetical protein
MNEEEKQKIRKQLAEIEEDFQSEDFMDDLSHPAEVIEGLISMVKKLL